MRSDRRQPVPMNFLEFVGLMTILTLVGLVGHYMAGY